MPSSLYLTHGPIFLGFLFVLQPHNPDSNARWNQVIHCPDSISTIITGIFFIKKCHFHRRHVKSMSLGGWRRPGPRRCGERASSFDSTADYVIKDWRLISHICPSPTPAIRCGRYIMLEDVYMPSSQLLRESILASCLAF